jgi:hypothetical protein
VSDDDGEGGVELDHLDVLVVERADAANGELVERCHGERKSFLGSIPRCELDSDMEKI